MDMEMIGQGAAPPAGSWTHSHEEDTAGVMVYRAALSYPFPPSRAGRETLEFGAAGELTLRAPGPDDRTRARSSRWTALGMNRFTLGGTAEVPERVIEVIEATPEILKIRPA